MRKRFFAYWIGLFVLGCLTIAPALAFDPTTQTPALLLDEAMTVYYGNLARRNAGQPPLRWNRQLTLLRAGLRGIRWRTAQALTAATKILTANGRAIAP